MPTSPPASANAVCGASKALVTPSAGHCRPGRHRLTAAAYREIRVARFATWRAITGVVVIA